MLERNQARISGGQVMDKFVVKTASATLGVNDQVCDVDTTDGAVTITLPNVEEAAGRIYSIFLITDGGNDVTIQDQDESRDWEGDFTLADADDGYVLYSDGRKWHTLATTGILPGGSVMWRNTLLKAGLDSDGKDVKVWHGSLSLYGRNKTVDGETIMVLLEDSDGNVLLATGTSLPTADKAGYAKGCLFIKTDAGDGTKGLYENQGTTSLCDFNVIGDITNAEIDETLVKYATITLSNAEIKALRASPKELVAAPGANKLIEFISAVLVLTAGTEVLTEAGEVGDNMAVEYDGGSGAACSETIEATGFIDQAADTITTAVAKADAIDAKADVVYKNIALANVGAAEYAGNASADATMTVKVAYRIHDLS